MDVSRRKRMVAEGEKMKETKLYNVTAGLTLRCKDGRKLLPRRRLKKDADIFHANAGTFTEASRELLWELLKEIK